MGDDPRPFDRDRLRAEIERAEAELHKALGDPGQLQPEKLRSVLESHSAKLHSLLELDPSVAPMLFGSSACGPVIEGPCRSIGPIADFDAFLRALPAVLPEGSELEFCRPSRACENEIRALARTERVWEGGLLVEKSSDFRVLPTAENIERLCAIHAKDPTPGFAVGIRAFMEGALVMDWYEWFSEPAWFSSLVDGEALKSLALRCGGELVGPFLPEDVKTVDGRTLPRER